MNYSMSKAALAVETAIRAYLLKDGNGNYVMKETDWLPLYMEGPPGVGKSQTTKEIADNLGIGYVSFSLTHHTRNSLLGLPVISELPDGSKCTTYTMSEVIEKVEEQRQVGKTEGILLLDEFPCVSDTIMPAMLAFLQTKNIGMHRLPRGWVIVLCGNPPKYNKNARVFDAAVMDRVRRIGIDHSVEDFLSYGRERGLHEAVLEFVKIYPDALFVYEKKDNETELVTARSWENLSESLKVYEQMDAPIDCLMIGQYVKSEKLAARFFDYYEQYSPEFSTQVIDSIINGEVAENVIKSFKKNSAGKQWKMIEHVLNYALRQSESDPERLSDNIGNLIAFIDRVDEEALYQRAYRRISGDPMMLKIMTKYKNARFKRWCVKMYKGDEAV